MKAAASKAEAASKGSLAITPTLVSDDTRPEIQQDFRTARSELSPEQESETDCIIFHSSGSSGTPKVGSILPNERMHLTVRQAVLLTFTAITLHFLLSQYHKNIASGQKQHVANHTRLHSRRLRSFMAVSAIFCEL